MFCFLKCCCLIVFEILRGASMEHAPWTALPEVTGELCPNTCMWRHMNISSKLFNGKGVCCQECSCDDDCGLESNCCFPELDKYQTNETTRPSCTLPSTYNMNVHGRRSSLTSYFMIDQNPINGCIIPINKSHPHEQCGHIPVAWWGSLFPVTSMKTGKIYRNLKCAECHNDTDVKKWDPEFVCVDGTKRNVFAIQAEVAAAEYPSTCFYYFKPEGSDKILAKERCVINPLDYCAFPNLFRIPEGINLTRADIINACGSGFRSAVKSYSNVFCHICSKNLILEDNCYKTLVTRAGDNFLTLILDWKKVGRYSSTKSDKDEKIACKRIGNGMNQSDCVPIYCPTGQMKLGNECDFPAKLWHQACFLVSISLHPIGDTGLDFSDIEGITTCLTDKTDKNVKTCLISPWDKQWSIINVYYRNDSFNSTTRQDLIVSILYNKYTISPEPFMKMVKTTMEGGIWTFNVRNKTLRLSQNFSRESPSTFRNSGNTANVVNFFRKPYDKITITKTFFCHQTQLQSADYELDQIKHVLYLKKEGIHFYRNEYSLVETASSVQIRICLLDAGYEILTSSAFFLEKVVWTIIFMGILTTILV